MTLTVFRKNDLWRALGQLGVVGLSIGAAILAGKVVGPSFGWRVFFWVVVLGSVLLWLLQRFAFRCPRCLANLARHGWARGVLGGWVKTGDMTRGRLAGAAQVCGVCELDLTQTRHEDWPQPASLDERKAYWEGYRRWSRERQNGRAAKRP